MMEWIRRGLRFECQPDCGQCCTGETRAGSVFIEAGDIEPLARALAVPPRTFLHRHVREEDDERELIPAEDGSCPFLANGRCSVYDARPLQCRTYPFLPTDGFSPIESPYTWRYEKRHCPGVGKGRLYKKAEIAAIARGRKSVSGFDV